VVGDAEPKSFHPLFVLPSSQHNARLTISTLVQFMDHDDGMAVDSAVETTTSASTSEPATSATVSRSSTTTAEGVPLDPGTPRRHSVGDPNPARKRQRIDGSDSEILLNTSPEDIAKDVAKLSAIEPESQQAPEKNSEAAVIANTINPASNATATMTGSDDQSQPHGESTSTLEMPKESEIKAPPFKRNSSLVTINIRAPRTDNATEDRLESSQSSETKENIPKGNEENNKEDYKDPDGHSAAQDLLSKATEGSRSASASSELSSPKIEATEPTDIDDYDPSELVNIVEQDLSSVYLQFPYASSTDDILSAVANLAQLLQEGDISGSNILEQLTEWLSLYLTVSQSKEKEWLEDYDDHSDFWEAFCGLIDALTKRNVPFSSAHEMDLAEIDDLRRLWIGFSRLVLRLVEIDIQSLELFDVQADSAPELISWPYVSVLLKLILQNLPIYHMINRNYRVEYTVFIREITAYVVSRAGGDGFAILSRYVCLGFPKSRPKGLTTEKLWPALELSRILLNVAVTWLDEDLIQKDDGSLEFLQEQVPRDGYTACYDLTQMFNTLIEKAGPTISKPNMMRLTETILNMIVDVCRTRDFDVLEIILTEFVKDDTIRQNPGSASHLAYSAWRFSIFKRLITGSRMELRVQGIIWLNDELVRIHNDSKVSDKVFQPLMDFMCTSLLQGQLIDYIVGAESHPELIQRSGNILGFLVVNKRFSNEISDHIWEVGVQHEDPRVRNAVLHMLQDVVSLMDYPAFQNICLKLPDLPLNAFDPVMIDFCIKIFAGMRKTQAQSLEAARDETQLGVVMQLLRRSAIEMDQSLDASGNALHEFSFRILNDICRLRLADDSRHLIYRECVEDIKTHKPEATGSVVALSLFLRKSDVILRQLDIRYMAELELTSSLVKDLSAVMINYRTLPLSGSVPLAIRSRLDLVLLISIFSPESISNEDGEKVWRFLVGDLAPRNVEREQGWSMLLMVMRDRLGPRNEYIDRCISTYLPDLQPEFYTNGLLEFVHKVVDYELRSGGIQLSSESQIQEIAGAEQLWRIIIDAPNGTVEVPATNFLVRLYLDLALLKQAAPSVAEATHVAFVERCLQQAKQARAEIRATPEATGSSDDESMVIVPSQHDILRAETKFARSLAVLQEFLREYKKRPQYAQGGSVIESPDESDPIDFAGEPVTIRWQAYIGASEPVSGTFTIGAHSRLSELRDKLSKASKLRDFRAFYSGQRFDFTQNPSQDLQSAKIINNAAFLIKEVMGSEDVSSVAVGQPVSPVEARVLEHFDSLFEFLALEDSLAEPIWELLRQFSPPIHIMADLFSESVLFTDVMPSKKPYKMLYTLHNLRSHLEERKQNNTVDEAFVARAVNLLTMAVLSPDLLEGSSLPLQVMVMSTIIDCLLRYLSEPVSKTTSSAYFQNTGLLVEALLGKLSLANSTELLEFDKNGSFALLTFFLIIFICQYSRPFFEAFTASEVAHHSFRWMIIEDPRAELRHAVSERIVSVCKPSIIPPEVNWEDFASFFWKTLSNDLAIVEKYADHSSDLFEALIVIFRALCGLETQIDDLEDYFKGWSQLLIEHKRVEVVGKPEEDHVISGFAKLLVLCVRKARTVKLPLLTE
jgi:ubiquitin carboxyl-terminal hydrolase 34